jgi:protein CpxP
MKGFKAVFSAIAGAALFCAMLADAQGPPQGGGPGFGMHRGPLERALGPGPGGRFWNDPAMVEKLGLSDNQRKGMDDILLQHQGQLIDMHANVEKAELAMQPLMSADQPNEEQILAQIDKIAQARVELEKANARFLLAVRAKLSPDQWKQLQAARAERRLSRPNGPGPAAVRPHHMHPQGAPDSIPQGGPQAPTPVAPGPQSMISQPPAPEEGPFAQ